MPDSRLNETRTGDTKLGETKPVVEPETKRPAVTTAILTLPNLIGKVTANILTALENGNEATKGEAVKSGRREIRMWYESQPVEDRKEIAKNVRRLGEQYKQVCEQLHLDIVTLAMQDL